MVSMCSLCGKAEESTTHLFMNCSYASSLWNWLSAKLSYMIDLSTMEALFSINRRFNSQVNDVLLDAIINLIWVVWTTRNHCRFNNKVLSIGAAKNLVISTVSLSGKLSSGTMSNSIDEFVILKQFNIDHHSRAPKIKEVVWLSPPCNWTKCNIDGAAQGSPGSSAYGGIFRGHNAAALGCFSCNLDCSTSLVAELSATMNAIEIANNRGWFNLWIDTDSILVLKAFNRQDFVPSRLQSRWKNRMVIAKRLSRQVTHIYREGNHCADKLANHGIHNPGFI